MNKKYLIFPFISAALISCTGIKSPDFEPYSKSVDLSVFQNKLEKSGFAKYLELAESTYGSAYTGYEIHQNAKCENVALYENEGIEEGTYSFKYDKENQIALSTLREKTDYSRSGAMGVKNQSVSAVSVDRQYQYHDIDEESKLVSVDKNQKVYYLTDSTNPELLASKRTFSIEEYGLSLYSWTDYLEDKKTTLEYYVDGKVFTVKQVSKQNVINQYEQIKTSSTKTYIYQYRVVNKEEVVFHLSLDSKVNVTYLESGNGHSKNEVISTKEKIYHTMDIHVAKVTLSKIDLSTFALRDADLDEAL